MLSEYIISCLEIYYVVNIFFKKIFCADSFMLLVCIEVCCGVVFVVLRLLRLLFYLLCRFFNFFNLEIFLCLFAENNFFFEKFIFRSLPTISSVFASYICQRLFVFFCPFRDLFTRNDFHFWFFILYANEMLLAIKSKSNNKSKSSVSKTTKTKKRTTRASLR